MRKVLFLDFDGVLNHRAHFARLPPGRTASEVEHDDNSFDRVCVARLDTILERTGCSVIISSSWRHMYPLAKLVTILRQHGFRYESRIIGVTPDFPDRDRGHEIQASLDALAVVEVFAILDDDSDMAHLKSFLVQTSFDTGLQDVHVEAVVRMLNRGSSNVDCQRAQS